MAPEKAFISVRVDAETKRQVEVILADMGLSISTAVNVYLNTLARRKEIPFEVRLDDEVR
ncbi:MAG: type II toxin-antitoxin system RelB/DinJ family antitoxin [Lachnospiraceae bacterium]|nr:type II toxin-antitoxin system RelB/DinJ family antitoxin [Lachnospiraceae bacterium]